MPCHLLHEEDATHLVIVPVAASNAAAILPTFSVFNALRTLGLECNIAMVAFFRTNVFGK